MSKEETMDFARRVSTFDIDEIDSDQSDQLNFEREYLMGGGMQKSGSSSNVPLLDREGQKDVWGLRLVLLCSLLAIGMGSTVLFSCIKEVDYSNHYYLCILGMAIAFLMIVSGVVSWLGIWRALLRDMNPMTLAHGLSVITFYGFVSYICILYYYWHDRNILGSIPMDGVDRHWLSLLSVGAIAILMLFVIGTLSLKWKAGGVYRWTHTLNALVLLGVGVVLMILDIMTIKYYRSLAVWPVCWSVYLSMVSGVLMILSNGYGLILKSRKALINYLFLLPLNMIFVSASYFNYFSARLADGSRADELYMSAIIGIASQLVMAFAFVTGFTWRMVLTV
jgi:hypothetical protein